MASVQGHFSSHLGFFLSTCGVYPDPSSLLIHSPTIPGFGDQLGGGRGPDHPQKGRGSPCVFDIVPG
jgi:hypothetical protein